MEAGIPGNCAFFYHLIVYKSTIFRGTQSLYPTRSTPMAPPTYPTAENAWKGGIELYPYVAEDLPPVAFSADYDHHIMFHGATWIGAPVSYRVIPMCTGTRAAAQVLYYVAYDPKLRRTEWV